jgi:hypothetical protein
MGKVKEFGLFCESHALDPSRSTAWEAFRRDRVGLPWGEEQGGACPTCGKNSVKVSNGKWFCFYCREDGELPDSVELTPDQQAAEQQLRKEKQAENRDRALKIWGQSIPITGSNATVSTYFDARRLSLERIPHLDGVMRWHTACPFGPGNKVPCIVSLFRDALTDEPMAIHRTHIVSASAGKAERKAYGTLAGSAIKLWPLSGKALAVGEGIENVLAAVALGITNPPAWAATVANNLSRVPVIPGVERLFILADNDAHKKGQEHANILRRKWRDRGREVLAKIPIEVGKDFNDVLTEGRS